MRNMKRVLSFVLALLIVVGLVPMKAHAASTLIDAAIFCSDVHGSSTAVPNVFAQIKADGISPSVAGFVGDTNDKSVSSSQGADDVTSQAQEVFDGITCLYAFGSHDDEGGAGVEDVTGLLYGEDGTTNFYVYSISQSSMESSNPSTSGFTTTVASLDKTKPLFIMSHMPLHERRNDNNGAAAWYTAISAAAESMDIVFFWGHNHTGESDVDRAAYYVAKDGTETMTIEGGSTVTPNFTYMNAGYIGNTASRGGYATTVQIYSDSLVFQDYNSSGAVTDNDYTHNVTVTREFANGSTDSGSTDDGTDTGTGETTTSGTVYVLTDTLTTGKNYLIVDANEAGSGNALVNSSGSVGNTTVTIKNGELTIDGTTTTKTYIELSDNTAVWTSGTSSSSSDVTCFSNNAYNSTTYYLYHDSGALSLNTSTSKNNWTYASNVITYTGGGTTYYLNYSDGWNVDSSATSANVYIYEETTVDVAVTLSSISATCSKTYDVGGTFAASDLVVTATYSDGSTAVVTPTSVSDPDMTTAGTKTVTVTYTEGDVTKTTTVNITVNEVISDTATLTDFEITTEPDKTAYYLGNTLNTTGMVVTATYNDNGTIKTKVLDAADYTVSEVDMTTEGEKTVTVSYTYNGTTRTDTFTVTVTERPYNQVVIGTAGEEKTVYVLVDSITSGEEYLIVNINAAGSGYAVGRSGTAVASDSVTVINDGTNIYIESTDIDSTSVWTAGTSGSSYTFINGSYYLYHEDGALSFATSGSKNNWTWGSNALYYTGGKTTRYLTYSSGWTLTTSSANVYLYQKKTIDTSTEVVYTMRAEDLKQVVDTNNEDTLTAALNYCLQGNAADLETLPSGGSYSFTVMKDEAGIITSIASDGTVTFTGKEGTATVKVAYTWTVGGTTYTVYRNITIEATDPYYTLVLHKANITYVQATAYDATATYFVLNEDGTYTKAEGVTADNFSSGTYYVVSATQGAEITAPVVIKGIEAGDRYGVWAVITGYDGILTNGVDADVLDDVEDGAIQWSSSDETIATVDPYTGIITFTGKDGTVQITADYAYGTEGEVATDTITISVTKSLYSVPADGTSDFPEFPNEGAIRFDKTATAVGNFSQTGIAQIELSMTGVPYTTGSEIDVVLMLDMTGSMTTASMNAAEAAALAFAEQIILNDDGSYNKNRISIQVFSVNGVTELWAMSAVTKDTYSSLVTAIQGASDNRVGGGTPYSTALSGCKDVLDAAKKDGVGNNRQQFCVFVSDGTPTSMTTISNYDAVKAGTATSYTTNTSEDYWGTYPEYYSTLMKDNGVTVYGVYTSAAAGSSSSNQGGGDVNDTETATAIMETVASSDDKVYTISDYTNTSALTGVFTEIAQDIMQAATDVTVEDQITDEYTMIFDIPTGTESITGVTNDFYIEFLKYTLDASTHERTGTSTSVTKLYLKNTNGVLSAAKDSSGTAYDAPVFTNTTLGEKGTLYYWTTDSSYAGDAAVTYTVDGTYYYFIPYGIKATDEGYDSTKWFNMTSGAYANGTVDSTNMSDNLVIATPYFVYNATTKMIYWTVEKLENATTEYALRYFLYLDNSATEVGNDGVEVDAGTYPTNDHAYLTYTNFNGNACRQEFVKPQLTWNGAQVSYVFYLVNEAGQPINKSGQVVDFANATFITDVFTHAVVWNGDNAVEELNVEYLADDLLPDDYIIYDENAKYTIHVYQTNEGVTVFDYFIIDGSDSGLTSYTTTKVYNTKAGNKYADYGIYSAEAVGTKFNTTDANDNNVTITTTKQASLDYSDTTVAFAVLWKPELVEDTIVVDFGLDVLINVVQNDLLQNTISGIGLGNSVFQDNNIIMNSGVYTSSKLGTAGLTLGDGNTISIENENAIRFHQTDMVFTSPITFYYESPVEYYEGSNKKEGFMYSSVTVIPATTIYYEDDFLTYIDTNEEEQTEFEILTEGTAPTSGVWYQVGTTSNATQAQDRPGVSQVGEALDADNLYGYDSAYTNCAKHSLDSAMMVHVDANTYARATFTFYGTGFDIISLTSSDTGTLAIKVTDASGNKVAAKAVNTYYGYAYGLYKATYTYTCVQAATEATETTEATPAVYSWVRTSVEGVTEAGENGQPTEEPEVGNTYVTYQTGWYVCASENALYQVPVMKASGLEYGKYTVTITATYASALDQTADEGYDLYLDAIRIYDPTGVVSGSTTDKTVSGAYEADGEGWPMYTELRDQIIAKEDFDAMTDGQQAEGVIFIDNTMDTSNNVTYTVADYASYGPNNELYLAAGQSVSFALNQTYASIFADVQIAMKLGNGTSVSYEIYNAAADGTKSNTITGTLTTATDLYYSVKDPDGDPNTNDDLTTGTIVIKNTSGGILSITNIKFTFTENPNGTATASEEGTDTSAAAASYNLMRLGNKMTGISTLSTTTATTTASTGVEETEQTTETTETNDYMIYVSADTVAAALATLNVEEEVEDEVVEDDTNVEDDVETEEPTEPETPEAPIEPEVPEVPEKPQRPEEDKKPGKGERPENPGKGHKPGKNHRDSRRDNVRENDGHHNSNRGWQVG